MTFVRGAATAAGRHPRGLAQAAVVMALLAVAGCAKPADVIETGALLVRIRTPADAPVPDELRVSIYDEGGVVFKNARIPEGGVIVPPAAGLPLGTILIQPGVSRGLIRVHVRGLANGMRILDGVGRVPTDARQRGVFELALATKVPYDDDLDDVPDAIDDCLTQPDPEQTGCGGGDGSTDASTDAAAPQDAAPTDAPIAGAGGGDVDAGGPVGSGGQVFEAVGTGGQGGPGGLGGSGGQGGLGGVMSGGGTGGRGTGGAAVGSGGITGSGGSGTGGTPPTDGGAVDAVKPGDGGPADAVPKALGSACTASTECASAFCVDKFCCQTACNQPCQVCSRTGACTAVVRLDDTPECAGTKTCNASGKCVAD